MFNEKKYQKCIGYLVEIKVSIIIGCMVLFAVFGAIIGIPIMDEITKEPLTIAIAAGIGGVIGLIVGLASTWRVEMKIQEAYWRIDMLNELKKQNLVKNTPVAKTVVAIENKQAPQREESKTEVKEVQGTSKEENK